MDILDPLETSPGDELIETKVVISKVHMESDEEQNVVDHLSPQTLLETPGPGEEVQYSLRSPEGSMVTYRVLQVESGNVDTVPQIVSTQGSNFSTSPGIQQVHNINGQLYVIGNPNEVFASQGGGRAIAPRPNMLESTGVVHNIKKRDERRRATHNEVERRRRDKINNWITKLSKLIPDSPQDIKGNGQYDGHSKGGILAKACEYILELQQGQSNFDVYLKENKNLKQTIEILKQKNFMLERENKEFREMLKRSGIDAPSEVIS